MVDVGDKEVSTRRARARTRVRFSPGIRDRVLRGELPKGAVIETARIAGIMAAKRTHELVPLCHPLRLSGVAVEIGPAGPDRLEIVAEVRCEERTGVEMEALCAASVAALCVYDMVKAVDRGLVIEETLLLHKEGGRSGTWHRESGDDE